jgi:4-hydroxybenzoate polyprenyltransferase
MRFMISVLNLIRWQNLLLIILVQVLIKYALFDAFNVLTKLDTLNFSLLVLATVLIAASGNIINDIYDIETDTINKPDKVIVGKSISEKTAFNLFFVFSVLGVGIGFYLSNVIGKSGFAALFVIISALLYVYASYLKQTFLIGNIVISGLVAMSILIVGIFDLLPVITEQNRGTQVLFFEILLDYALFAFMINLLREILKDIIDIDGDYNAEMKTLPIIIGRIRAAKVVFVLSFIPLFALSYYIITYLYKQPVAVVYFILFIVGPLLYFSVKCFSAETKKALAHLSLILKLVMLFGVLSLLLYPFILNNA